MILNKSDCWLALKSVRVILSLKVTFCSYGNANELDRPP